MIQAHRTAGFLLSGLLHIGVVVAFAPHLDFQASQGPVETPLGLSLDMFQQPSGAALSADKPQHAIPDARVRPALQPAPEKRSETAPVLADAVPGAAPLTGKALLPQPVMKPPGALARAESPVQQQEQIAAPAPLIPIQANFDASLAEVVDFPVSRRSNAEYKVEKARYMNALTRRIQQKKYYPGKGRLRREEGEVLVAFLIGKSGQITNIHVTRSSGSASLDDAAVKTLERINPFQALPEELGMQSWELAVPITYKLRN